MILVLYIECTTTKILLLLKGSHHEPSKQSDENRASKREESGSIIKRRILFHAKLFWSESEAAAVCWGEDECAKKMSFGSLLSCSSWLYLEVIRVGELLSLGPCGLAAPHSGAFTSQFASRSSPPTPHKSLFKAHLASPYYCRLPFNFTIFCKVRMVKMQ